MGCGITQALHGSGSPASLAPGEAQVRVGPGARGSPAGTAVWPRPVAPRSPAVKSEAQPRPGPRTGGTRRRGCESGRFEFSGRCHPARPRPRPGRGEGLRQENPVVPSRDTGVPGSSLERDWNPSRESGPAGATAPAPRRPAQRSPRNSKPRTARSVVATARETDTGPGTQKSAPVLLFTAPARLDIES